MGLGAGWNSREHAAFGIPFPATAERVSRLDEAVEVIQNLWTTPRFTFAGRYFNLDAATCRPAPLQRPRPPVLIGGAGEQLTLKVVAKHANIWNTAGSVEVYEKKLQCLHRHCSALRRTEEIVKSWVGWGFLTRSRIEEEDALRQFALFSGKTPEEVRGCSLIGSADQICARVSEYAALGITQIIISVLAPFDRDHLIRFADNICRHFSE